MILVLFGTNPYRFDRLLNEIEKIAGETDERFTLQLGNSGKGVPICTCFDFLEREKLLELMEKAEFVITQGGFGSIYDCLTLGKKVIAVPRKAELFESQDDQTELVKMLENQGKVLGVYNIENLKDAMSKIKDCTFALKSESRIPAIVAEYINSVI